MALMTASVNVAGSGDWAGLPLLPPGSVDIGSPLELSLMGSPTGLAVMGVGGSTTGGNGTTGSSPIEPIGVGTGEPVEFAIVPPFCVGELFPPEFPAAPDAPPPGELADVGPAVAEIVVPSAGLVDMVTDEPGGNVVVLVTGVPSVPRVVMMIVMVACVEAMAGLASNRSNIGVANRAAKSQLRVMAGSFLFDVRPAQVRRGSGRVRIAVRSECP
jgi:hypothetical protein